jgi:hypothetical protein
MNTLARQQVVSTDLFGSGTEKYPHAPGFKKTATSKAAAKSIAVYATTKRHDVLMAFVAAGDEGFTPDNCARTLKPFPIHGQAAVHRAGFSRSVSPNR